MVAIHQQCSGRLGPSESVERQQVNLGVPKHVPAIVIAGHCSGANGNALIGGICSAIQVVSCESECPLRRLVTANLETAATPTLVPSRAMALDNSPRAQSSCVRKCCPACGAGIIIRMVAAHE